MGIYRTNNPLEYAEVDGIIIDEQAPAPSVLAVGAGVVTLVGKFQRGPLELTRVSGIKNFHEVYGKSSYLGNIQLKNKKFAVLKIVRALAADAAIATKTFDDGTTTDIITFTAKDKGAYGNNIKVTIEAGSVEGSKYTIEDTNTGNTEFFPTEIYDNVLIADAADAFGASLLVDVTVDATTSEPAVSVATALAAGSDGTIADTDYEAAIARAAGESVTNILFLDDYNQVRNGYLKVHAGLTRERMVICSEEEADTTTDNETDVATLRDTEGRIIYAVNWCRTSINGVNTYTNPASWYASILSQIGPNIDPAYAANTGFLFGINGLKKDLTRDDYVRLMAAGCSAFEFDQDIGFKIKSGIVTQISNSSKLTVLRRRMADYLTNSVGKFLKNYQNAPNRLEERTASKAAILGFITGQETDGILPKDSEVQDGLAKIVDVETENTNDSIAAGKFIIIYKQRIYSSMRFIVLKAEIGESVVVTEGE